MYQISKYSDIIETKDADTRKRYDLIAKLSNNFTVSHPLAMEMDKLLTEQIDLEQSEIQKSLPKPTRTGNTTITAKNRNKFEFSDLEDRFNNLFEAIKKNIPQIIQYDIPNVVTSPFTRPKIPSFQMIVDDVIMGNNVFLIGGAGSGKTTLAETIIAGKALGREHITINCSQWTSPTEIIGGQTMDGYVEGKLIDAWQKGLLLVLDELPKIDPNTAGLFNDALAKTKIPNATIFNSRRESFVKHPNFACIATGNIYPDSESTTYGANNQQDLSLLDRFAGSVYHIDKNPELEQEILQNKMVWSICNKIRSAVEKLNYTSPVSLRLMANAVGSYNLEMKRINTGTKDVNANEGKTLRSTIDSFLSTFNNTQQKNIKEQINYNDIFPNFQYRKLDPKKSI